MDSPGFSAPYFRFGPFELNSQTCELRKHGVKLKLPEQSCRILQALLERPGELVCREDLKPLLWNADTFVDFEHGLNVAVRRLREALGEGAAQPRYIETLPRRGYRFLVAVEVGDADSSSTSAPNFEPAPAAAVPTRSSYPHFAAKKWTWIAASSAASALALLSFTLLKPPPAETVPLTATALTGYVGAQRSPSFSPDGERIAFSWKGESRDNFDIYIKQIGVPAPLRIDSDSRPDISPAWSPDGRSIAFIRLLDSQKAELLLAPPVPGGPERHICEFAAPNSLYERSRLLAWSLDSRWLVVSSGESPGGVIGLLLISVENGSKYALTSPPAEYDDLDPAFSPDMKWLAFVRHSGPRAGDLYIAQLDTSLHLAEKPRRLTFDDRPMTGPVWAENSQELIFARYAMVGRHSLWRIKVTPPSKPEPILISAENASALAISPKTHRLVYTREARNSDIWSVELGHPQKHGQEATSKILIASNREESTPSFSPDGRRIAFQSSRTGWKEVWIADRRGANASQITDLHGSAAGYPRWSPDGSEILFHLRRHTDAILYRIRLADRRARKLAYNSGVDYQGSWSHDGRSIYFASRRSGDEQVWKVPVEGGLAEQVTRKGGWSPFESADASALFYTKPNEPGIWKMPLRGGGDEQLIVPAPVAADGSAYAVGDTAIYFVRQSNDGKQDLERFDRATGKITSVVKIASEIGLGLALSPDEKELLYSQVDHVDSDLMLVENFR